MAEKNLPTYKLNVLPDDESGIEFVALVDTPAIGDIGFGNGLFLAFKSDVENHYEFKVTSEEKRIVSGPLLIPDAKIYRKVKDGDSYREFYVEFPKESVYNMVLKFFRNQNTANVNEMHNPNLKAKDVYLFESFFINRERMDPPKGFEELPDGSHFVSYKVDNDEIWNKVKAGEFKGFSIEGLFIPESETITDAALAAAIAEVIVQSENKNISL